MISMYTSVKSYESFTTNNSTIQNEEKKHGNKKSSINMCAVN